MGQGIVSPKTILITGASSGIGAGIARELISRRESHRLVLTARRTEALQKLVNEAESSGTACLAVTADLADAQAPQRILDATIARFGHLDVLINNAGLGLPEPFSQADASEMARQIQVNLTAPIVLTRLAVDQLLASKGNVINIGSSITCVANPIFGAYGATKAGLAYWNDALRRELKPRGVSVSLVEPGPVSTEFFEAVVSRSTAHQANGGTLATAEMAAADKFREYAAVDPPPEWLSANVADVARRVVRLIDRPKRRISVLRRTVWPFRVIGLLVQAFPGLGDLAIAGMVKNMDADPARKRSGVDAGQTG